MNWKALLFVFVTFCMLQVWGQEKKQAEASNENRSSKAFGIQLIQFGEAKIDDKEYEGKPFTGVVVEFEYPMYETSGTFNASSVYVKSSSMKQIAALAVFVIRADESIKFNVLGGTQMRGWKVFIGNDEFQCCGSMLRMAMLLGEGGLKASSKEGGSVKLGFIFPESLKNIVNISLLGETMMLKLPNKS